MKRAKHINMTEKEFESVKRSQFKILKKCLYGNYGIMIGSYYFPQEVYFKLETADNLIKEAHKIYLNAKTHRTRG